MLVKCSVCGKEFNQRSSKTGIFPKFHRIGYNYCPGNFKEGVVAQSGRAQG